jgi:Kef-type K+ transport system membrane component KefB
VASGHGEEAARLVFWLAVILLLAKVGGDAALRLGQPAVLGELVAGIAIGNLGLFGFHGLEAMKTDQGLGILAQLGVLILLFQVGLESTLGGKPIITPVLFSEIVAMVVLTTLLAPLALRWSLGRRRKDSRHSPKSVK